MKRLTTIELHKEDMKFSAGHFAIFSATERENLHGHNYTVSAAIDTRVSENGLNFDYRFYKKRLYQLCRELNQRFLIAEQSDFLTIKRDEKYINVLFDNEELRFLERDVLLLPLCNITVEELSRWFIERLTEEEDALTQHQIDKIVIKVFSGPGQSASATWVRS